MGAAQTVCDVVVLGGGPAGCAAAIVCAQAGLRVALVEALNFPRDRPGESLHPGVEPLLEQLDSLDAVSSAGFPRHTGNWVDWGGARRFEPFGHDANGPWRGFQAWRATFDALLLARVRTLGARLLQPCRAIRVIREADGRLAGVVTSAEKILARYVIDAGGGAHWLARQLGIQVQNYSPRLIARYGYATGHCPARDDAPLILGDHTGWTWIAHVKPSLYHWTRLTFGRSDLPDDWLPAELNGLQTQGAVKAADVSWRKAESVAGPGYFLAGDAAAVLDPLASHGVLKALLSGMTAAKMLNGVVVHGNDEVVAAGAYNQWLSNWFEADVEQLRSLYGELMETSLPASQSAKI